ncbi:MAG: AMP-binding protein [Cyanobacteria bacterium P01_D01_bin.56]
MISQTPLRSHNDSSSLVELLQQRAQDQPNQRAYTFLVDGELEEVHLTYAELDCQARAIAAHLRSLIPFGERALLLYPQGLEFIAAFFGCLYAGVVAVPAYPPRRNQKMSRLQSIIADAQATVALTTTALLPTVEQRFEEAIDLGALKLIATDRLSLALAYNWQPLNVQSETLAFLQYTSGSTGTPKGVMVSHGNILHNSEYIKQAFDLSSESISITWLPSFHDMGLIDGVIQPMYIGFLGVLMSPATFMQKPIRWLQAISRYRATHCGGPNLGYELCTQKITSEHVQTLNLSHWNSAYSGSEPVRQQTLEKFIAKFASCGFEPQFFYPCYGMAEATLMISGVNIQATPVYCSVETTALGENRIVETAADQNVTHLVGCGHAWLDTEIVIVDPDTLQPCPSDQVGEIWVSGSSVAQGYWHRPEQTQDTFKAYLANSQKGPFLRTGDLGFLQDGELFITGRLKDVIIIWGRNHYPQDIELTVYQSHEALRPEYSAAFSVEIDGIERLVIAQEVKRSHLRRLDVDEVTKAIRHTVSQQHDLQVYGVVLLKTASIPKTSSGKIQRHACRNGFLADDLNIVGKWILSPQTSQLELTQLQKDVEKLEEQVREPESVEHTLDEKEQKTVVTITENSIQDWLIERLAAILKIDPDEIDIQEPFSTYGLDSSVSMSLTGELADWLGCDLEPTLFWEHPNIENMTPYLLQKTQILTHHHS